MSVRVLALLLGFKGQMVLAGIDDETAWHGMDGMGYFLEVLFLWSLWLVFWVPRWMDWLGMALLMVVTGFCDFTLVSRTQFGFTPFSQSWTGVTLERIQ